MVSTKVKYEGICKDDQKSRIFQVVEPEKKVILKVIDFKDGTARISTLFEGAEVDFAEILAGCFAADSNFAKELKRAFPTAKTNMEKIEFSYSKITVVVDSEHADPKQIYRAWLEGADEFDRHSQPEKQIWLYTGVLSDSALKRLRAHEAKREYRFNTVCEQASELVCYIPMQYKDYVSACKWISLERNELYSSYMRETAIFAGRWARYMQWLMNKHDKDLESIAENALKVCRKNEEQYISAFRIKCAVNLLKPCWKFGDELYNWFLKKHGYDD